MGRVVNMAEWRLALHAKVVTLDRSLYQKARQKVLGRVLPAVINSLIKEFTNDLQQADTARRGRAKVIASHKEIVGFSNSNKDWLHLFARRERQATLREGLEHPDSCVVGEGGGEVRPGKPAQIQVLHLPTSRLQAAC